MTAASRDAKPAARHEASRPAFPPVVWIGIALGVFLAVEALIHGVILPLSLGGIADAALTVLLAVALGVILAELTRRHHRAVAKHAVRHGKRGALAAGRAGKRAGSAAASGAAKHGGRAGAAAVSWAREHARRKPEPGPESGPEPGDGPGAAASGTPEGPSWSWGLAASRHHWPAASEEEARTWAAHMSTDGKEYAVAEYPPGGGSGTTIFTYVNGEETEGDKEMASRIGTRHRARRAASTGTASVPSEWGAVVSGTADFEPENDGELLEWMSRQVTGLSAWAEALVDTYEHCTSVIGIDPKASAMLHDVADAAAQCAETMSAAKTRFTEHYELPREFAANGGLMTHDGRWVTGEGA